MKVFVADAAERSSLSIVRSLGSNGIEVHCGDSYPFSTSSFSKYCNKSFVYSDPQENSNDFIHSLIDILKDGNYDVVYSSREVTTIPISYYKKKLEKYVKVPFPDYDKMLLTLDKSKTFKLAISCGVPIPKTYFVDSMEELNGIIDTVEFPVVVKSRYKTTWNNGKPKMLKVTSKNYIHTIHDLYKISSEILAQSGKMPLIQEYIPGEGCGVEVLFNHGEPKAIFMHKRLREYPITGGASTLRESFYDGRLESIALNLMKNMEWHGVAMVEFKIDSRDGLPKLMEVNGRFWGSLPLSIASDVDFPYLLHTMVTKGEVDTVFDYKKGVLCRWLFPGDLLWLFSTVVSGNSNTRVLSDFFKFNGISDDIISKDDLFPIIGALNGVIHQARGLLSGRRNLSGEVK